MDAAVDCTWRWTVEPGGLRLALSVVPDDRWPAAWSAHWARVGISFALPGSMSAVDWFGRGPGPAYPDMGQAARLGWFAASVQDLQERTVRPQEAGARAGVRWARIGSSAAHVALELAADPAIALTVRPWSTGQLAAVDHDHQLRGDGRTHVVLDLAQAGVGTAACGPGPLPEYLSAGSPRQRQPAVHDHRHHGGARMTDPIEIETGVDGIVVRLHADERRGFDWFIDCNMATAWVGDQFRIFPGKYGEDPLWGDASELGYANGATVAEAFAQPAAAFTRPSMPPNVPPGTDGLHGAVWFETIYQDPADASGRTLYALYHNENYPTTLPFDPATGEGYRDEDWPPGLGGDETVQAVPRIGIMHSTDGGEQWQDRGLLLADADERIDPACRSTATTASRVASAIRVRSRSASTCTSSSASTPTRPPGTPRPGTATWRQRHSASAWHVSRSTRSTRRRAPRGAAMALPSLPPGTAPAPRSPACRSPRADGGGAVSQGDELYHWGPSVELERGPRGLGHGHGSRGRPVLGRRQPVPLDQPAP